MWVTPIRPLFYYFASSYRMLWEVKLSWMKCLKLSLSPVADVINNYIHGVVR